MKDQTMLVFAGVALAAAFFFTRRANAADAGVVVDIAPAAGWFPKSLTVGEPNYSDRKTSTAATLPGSFTSPSVGYYYKPSF